MSFVFVSLLGYFPDNAEVKPYETHSGDLIVKKDTVKDLEVYSTNDLIIKEMP